MHIEDLIVGEKYSPRSNAKKVFEFVKLSQQGDPCFKCIEGDKQHTVTAQEAEAFEDPSIEGLVVFASVKDFRKI